MADATATALILVIAAVLAAQFLIPQPMQDTNGIINGPTDANIPAVFSDRNFEHPSVRENEFCPGKTI